MGKRKPNPDSVPALRLEWRSPAELAENPRNWRRHPPLQSAALRDALAEVGWAGACLFNERTGRMIDGHLRQVIAQDQGYEKVPVLIGSWDEATEAKILATLDPIGALAEADAGKLEALLREVNTGSEALQQMLDDLTAQAGTLPLRDGLTDPDDVPEPPDQAVTQPGDTWQLGRHRLSCGDSGSAEDVDRLLDGAKIHLVHTDPPYGVHVEPRSNNAIRAGLSSFEGPKHHQSLDLARHPEKATPTDRKLRARDRPLANDFISAEEFNRLLHQWFSNLARVLEPGRCFYIWGGYSNLPNYPPALAANGLYFSQAIIWNKLHPVLTRKDFMGCFELAFYGWREGAGHQFYGPTNALDLWEIKKVNPQGMIHLTEKPVELAKRAIEFSSRPGENVLDSFAGSGSTLIAAEQTGRRAFLMELDPLYCDVIVRRYEQFTGHAAERRLAA
jgi:DNA modification methylase